MTNIHICTSDSLLAGAIEMKCYCPVCCRKDQDVLLGYVSSKCKGCGFESSFDALNETVRNRRKYLGMTKAEIAYHSGVNPGTVQTYEGRWPSEKYWLKTRELVEAHNASLRP